MRSAALTGIAIFLIEKSFNAANRAQLGMPDFLLSAYFSRVFLFIGALPVFQGADFDMTARPGALHATALRAARHADDEQQAQLFIYAERNSSRHIIFADAISRRATPFRISRLIRGVFSQLLAPPTFTRRPR